MIRIIKRSCIDPVDAEELAKLSGPDDLLPTKVILGAWKLAFILVGLAIAGGVICLIAGALAGVSTTTILLCIIIYRLLSGRR